MDDRKTCARARFVARILATVMVILLAGSMPANAELCSGCVESELTTLNSAYAAQLPVWESNGERILYTRYSNTNFYKKNVYEVLGDATVVNEQLRVSAPGFGANFPSSIAWGQGGAAIISEQVGINNEYLSFTVPSSGSIARTSGDGNGQGFVVKLKGDWIAVGPIGGADAEFGDMVRVSRNGEWVLIHWVSMIQTPGYTRTTKIFTAPFASMSGQFISNTGVDTDWEDQPGVIKHIETTQHYLNRPWLSGASFLPDGSQFLISDGVSIYLYNTNGDLFSGGARYQSIRTGSSGVVHYNWPEVAPDGRKFVANKLTAGGGSSGLFMFDISGANEEPLSTGPGAAWQINSPTFSPDGRRIAFSRGGQIWRLSGARGVEDCNDNLIPDICDTPGWDNPMSPICAYVCPSTTCGAASDCDADRVPDSCQLDRDGDGFIDACDDCPEDLYKQEPGICGCGISELDTDSDGAPDCVDGCPADVGKTAPGLCGCGVSDADTDGDGRPNCQDLCPSDPNKAAPGMCGCGVPDTDTDGDAVPDCNDNCPLSSLKTDPGICGCNAQDVDSDGDQWLDCQESCPAHYWKTTPGICGCSIKDADINGDLIIDCGPVKALSSAVVPLFGAIVPARGAVTLRMQKLRATKPVYLVSLLGPTTKKKWKTYSSTRNTLKIGKLVRGTYSVKFRISQKIGKKTTISKFSRTTKFVVK